jgi:hypothetical protein
MKPAANLTLVANFATSFASVGDTGGKFATGVNDTGSKFAAGVNDTGGNFPPISRTPAGKFATGVIEQYQAAETLK